MFSTILHGFLVSGSLIVAIGAQNAFVLKQGLLRQHVFWVCFVCFLCDFLLMSFGILGFGTLIGKSQTAMMALSLFGAAFLFVYGVRAFVSAYQGSSGFDIQNTSSNTSLQKTLTAVLVLTLLNPHVYLDTLVLIGGIAGTLSLNDKYLFLFGALSASLLWFFGLGYGARLLTPLFQKPYTWKILDALIGVIMWVIAAMLVYFAYGLFNK